MSKHWQSFWGSYRNADAQSEDDLFVQVGKTIARQPIPRGMFCSMVERIIERLELEHEDHLLDMCCGNGLISFELAGAAGHVTAVDFADHLIKAAMAFKSLPNIDYRVGDVSVPIAELVGEPHQDAGETPQKYLMNDALAYFDPEALGAILDNIRLARHGKPFRFLLTGIPNSELKWNFYDTPERKRRHSELMNAGDDTNDGLGRWWDPSEIRMVCEQRGLQVRIENQPDAISDYRMDALIWRA
jgi:SAM-dependent methyltransferase